MARQPKNDSADVVTAPGYTVVNGQAVKDGETPSGNSKYDNSERRWTKPSKRAEGYAQERKAKKHIWGQHKGEDLNDYKNGLRSGYLQCQSDHAGMFRYKQALEAGYTKTEAIKFSRERGTKIQPKKK